MFDVQLKSPNDGIASGPLGGARRTSSGGDCIPESYECYIIEDTVAPICECWSINTCEPYDEPEYEGADDFMAAGGGTDEEPE